MARETSEERQLRLICEVVEVLRAESIPCWLRGGWATDFFLGEITRPHEDVDFFAWTSDSERVAAVLARAGFEELGGPPPTAQRNFIKADELFHIAFLEKTRDGKLVTPSGRWDVRLRRRHDEADDLQPEEWPAGMLDAPAGHLGDRVAPIIDPAAQLYAKESAALIPGHPLTEKHRDDIERLRVALAARSNAC